MSKPIRVFWSPLGQRFYASRAYKIYPQREGETKQIVQITGEKFDVTDDIARAIVEYDLEFTPTFVAPDWEWCDGCDGTGLMEGWNHRDGFSCPKCKGEAKIKKETK